MVLSNVNFGKIVDVSIVCIITVIHIKALINQTASERDRFTLIQ